MSSWILLAFLLFFTPTVQKNIQGVFALTWIAGFCSFQQFNRKEQCDQQKIDLWDQQSFTIHGLWVDKQNTKSKFGKYNRSLIYSNQDLLQKMTQYFPPALKYSQIIDNPQFLWRHQWNTHGSDFANAVYNFWPAYTNFNNHFERNEILQLLFFKETIKFYEALKVRKIPIGLLTKDQLARIIGIKPKQMNIICISKNIVRQIRICFEIISTGFKIKDCSKPSNSCLDKMLILPGWLKKNQIKVMNP